MINNQEQSIAIKVKKVKKNNIKDNKSKIILSEPPIIIQPLDQIMFLENIYSNTAIEEEIIIKDDGEDIILQRETTSKFEKLSKTKNHTAEPSKSSLIATSTSNTGTMVVMPLATSSKSEVIMVE